MTVATLPPARRTAIVLARPPHDALYLHRARGPAGFPAAPAFRSGIAGLNGARGLPDVSWNSAVDGGVLLTGHLLHGNGPDEDLRAARRFLSEHKDEPVQRSFYDAPDHLGETLDDDVAWEIDRLRASGLHQAVAVDLTRPELEIPVLRMVIPGLEPLYDIPGYTPGARAQRRLSERTS